MTKKISKTRFIGGITVALLLPLLFFAVFKYLSRNSLHMPHYYIVDHVDTEQVNGMTQLDTFYHQVADITLTNQLGQKVSINNDLKGKIVVIDFFFTDCPTICPRLTRNMTLLQRAFKKNDSICHLVSITVNPERDSFPVLRAYADRFGVNHDHWWFLTGDKKAIYNYARNELFVSVQPGDGGPDDFIHTEKVVVLDKDRNIRGYYDGLDSAALAHCADDIILLSLENKHKKKR